MSRRKAPPATAVAIALCIGGCADMRAEVALPPPAADTPPPAAAAVRAPPPAPTDLAALRADDQRVADVAYRLAVAGAGLCPDLAPLTGLVLQSALQYSPRLRPTAAAYFHIDARPAVEAVAAGSPAEAAGLQAGDILVSVDGATFDPGGTETGAETEAQPATYAPVALALARIGSGVSHGAARLQVQRGDQRLTVMLGGRTGCAYDAQVLPGEGLTAFADGRHVFIAAGFVRYAAAPDTLALVLGHEFAHDLLRHRARLDRVGVDRRALGDLGLTPASLRLAEREADYVGLYLTARAGYAIDRAPDFWRAFPGAWADRLQWSHPDAAARITGLAAARDEIVRKQAAGAPLVPNPAR